MARKYFSIAILVLILTVGVFFYFKNTQADTTFCGIAEQCPAAGAICLGFPVGPAEACSCPDPLVASCGAWGTFICATNRWPGDTGITTCGGNEACLCNPTPEPTCVPLSGSSCTVTSDLNACGNTVSNTGTYSCTGICSASKPQPPSTPAPTTCSNACGLTTTATCGNACVPLPLPANYGNSCTVTGAVSNACGQVGSATGTIQCNGVCSAFFPGPTVPPNPPGYGTACTSLANACGQTNSGTIQCNSECSATPPPDSNCAGPTVTISANPNPVAYNTAATVSWSSANATSCSVSPGGWAGTSGARSTGNLITNTNYTASCTGPGGSNSASVTVVVNAAPTLTVSLSANSSGNAPLTTNFTAIVGGTAIGTINYTFWWHCLYAGTNVSAAITQCGDPDGTTGNANGNKYNGATSTSQDSISHTYSSAGTYIPLVIVERGGLAARATTTVTVSAAPTLEVSLSANPFSGTGSINSILTAAVSGTVTGPIDYTFWWNCGYTGTDASAATAQCGNPDGRNGNANGNSFNNVNSTSQNSVSHSYPTGTYTSLVIAERGGLAARAVRGVSVSNSPPSVSNVTFTEPDYCSAGPGGFVSWTYQDMENDPQANYRIQVYTNAGSLAYDSNQVNSASKTAAIPQLQLQFNTTYRAQVMVSQTGGGSSSWVSQTVCNGPGCAANNLTWGTPRHAYPRVNFSWIPPSPAGNQTVIFTDATTFSDGNVGGTRTWSWTAPSANPSSGTTSAFTTKYVVPGIYNVTDTVTDSIGYTCTLSQPVTVQESIPIWKEVGPK